jgi:hypothetical protein
MIILPHFSPSQFCKPADVFSCGPEESLIGLVAFFVGINAGAYETAFAGYFQDCTVQPPLLRRPAQVARAPASSAGWSTLSAGRE